VAALGVAALMILAPSASAQVSLDVVDQGTVYATYVSGVPAYGPYALGGTGLTAGSSSFSFTTYISPTFTATTTYTFTYISQAVVSLATYTTSGSLPSAGNAFLSFYAVSATGTWTLWAHQTDDGTVDSADFVPAGGTGFSMVGQRTFAAGAGGQTFTFNITTPFNNDLGGSFSGYTLTHQGAPTAVILNDAGYTAIPEPGTLALFGLGLLTFAAGYRIRRKKKA
jgi:hypothetical protein